jgi:hypothetical protein
MLAMSYANERMVNLTVDQAADLFVWIQDVDNILK